MNKKFIRYFIEAFGTLASVATLIAFIYKWDTSTISSCGSFLLGVLIIVVCSFYAIYQTQPKNKIVLTIRDFRIHISFGDLFAKKGVVVIPVNEYFDTIVDDHIIAHKTIHSQFIDKYFANDIATLDAMISRELQGKPTAAPRYQRNHAKVTPYPVGTCIDIVYNGVTYVLFALTKFNEEDVAYLEKKYFGDAIRGLMSHLHDMNNDRAVYMPVIGTGMSKLQRSHQRVLTYFLDCIDFTNESSLPAGLNIVVYEGDKDKVNLSLVEEYFEGTLSK
jgi:hypothetical protein